MQKKSNTLATLDALILYENQIKYRIKAVKIDCNLHKAVNYGL